MASAAPARPPRFVPFFNPLAARLLRVGRLLGPNALLTVRGRKSGEPRTTPVALVESGGRRWVIGTFGDVNWVRNLRASAEAEVTVGRRRITVHGRELTHAEAARFFKEVVAPYVGSGLPQRMILRVLGATDIVAHPDAAAERRPVFELTPIS
jgi:deazaflavin-dependent oxidoreductase (nitroreductase family)